MASLSPAAPDSTPLFFESAKPMIMGHLNDHLIPDLAKIVADYVVIPFKGMAFMAEHWKRYYNVEVEAFSKACFRAAISKGLRGEIY